MEMKTTVVQWLAEFHHAVTGTGAGTLNRTALKKRRASGGHLTLFCYDEFRKGAIFLPALTAVVIRLYALTVPGIRKDQKKLIPPALKK